MAPGRNLSNRTVTTWLAVLVLLALGLRIGWNVGPSHDEDSGRYFYSGNDPYYHDRAVDHILETGESLVFDEAINYPQGAFNPNPPLYDWTSALVAKFAEMGGASDPSGVALNSMVALWGALTVIPVFLIASTIWNRHAGLWAGFLMAASAPSITRGVFGFADHDATTMFWITLTMAFLFKGLKALDDREYVADWRHSSALKDGLRNSFAHNKQAMLWSTLAGLALSATALTWKGYPYVFAILAVAVGFQLLNDHVRNKDSTALFVFYVIPMLVATLVPLVYYGALPVFMDTTIVAGLYALIGVLIVGAILVPTRDLPSIIVFPALALAGILGLVLMLVVFPDVGATVFTGLGYFEQTKLYTTIAEAQRTELGRVAASFGFFVFLLAFWQLGKHTIPGAWKGDKVKHLLLSWSLVAIFMAFAATRFVMNAAPVFSLLAAPVVVSWFGWANFDNLRRRFRQQHGQNVVGAAFRSLDGRAVTALLATGILVILPNLWLGVDAAIPRDAEDPQNDHLGAFGIDFDVLQNGWGDAFLDLAERDADLPLEERPAFAAWWDYGHWATNIGEHPTMADPFQNHYRDAGRLLASTSEQEAFAWLSGLLIAGDLEDGDYESGTIGALSLVDDTLAQDLKAAKGPVSRFNTLAEHIDLEGDGIFDLYADLCEFSGSCIGYLGVDVRMYPNSANDPGIFYAPAFLADKNPDDFLAYRYAGGTSLNVAQYGIDDEGRSFRLDEAKITDATGTAWDVLGNQAYPKASSPLTPGNTAVSQGVSVTLTMTPTPLFFETLYAKAFGHAQNGFTPGDGLEHWRVVSVGAEGAVKILQYFPGAPVDGRVVDDGGEPMAGVEVTFVDGEGASHQVTTTDVDGRFTVLAPFSEDDDLTLTVFDGATILAQSTDVQITMEQAMDGTQKFAGDVVVERGTVSGTVFEDLDGDGAFNATNDLVLAGATVNLDGRTVTSGDDGSYVFGDVVPGSSSVTVTLDGYEAGSTNVALAPGDAATGDVALEPASSSVTVELRNDGEPLGLVPMTITSADDVSTSATSSDEGKATVTLAPGDYTLSVDYTVTVDGVETTYTAERAFTVAFGGDDLTLLVNVDATTA